MAAPDTHEKTNLHEKSVQQKLNAMGLHTSIITPTTGNVGAADVYFVPTEIKNAVASPGGYSILSSVLMTDKAAIDTQYNLYFFSSNVGPTASGGTNEWSAALNAAFNGVDEDALFYLDNYLGTVGLSSGVQYGNDSRVFHLTGLTWPVKAADNSTSIWVGAECVGAANTSDGDVKLRFTFLQD